MAGEWSGTPGGGGLGPFILVQPAIDAIRNATMTHPYTFNSQGQPVGEPKAETYPVRSLPHPPPPVIIIPGPRALLNSPPPVILNADGEAGKKAEAPPIPKNGETPDTKRGREEHKAYNPGPTYDTKVTLPRGLKPDAVDFENKIVRELKPDNPRAIKRGWKQVAKYIKELEKMYPGDWKGFVDTYKNNHEPWPQDILRPHKHIAHAICSKYERHWKDHFR